MNLADLGSGPPVVVIPGVQGRWEWMEPGIRALAEHCRVITFSLSDEPCAGAQFDERTGFACFVEQVREALDQCGLESAAICGVSYGGLVAAAFAARYPHRTRSLVVVSAPPPSWTPNARVRFYLRAPRLLAPVFWLASPLAMYRELVVAVPGRLAQLTLAAQCAWRALTHPPSATRMALRARLLTRMSLVSLSHVRMPALVVTGEEALDRVMPVGLTREYNRLIPHAGSATIERTGHVAIVTRPDAFGDVIGGFVRQHASEHRPENRYAV